MAYFEIGHESIYRWVENKLIAACTRALWIISRRWSGSFKFPLEVPVREIRRIQWTPWVYRWGGKRREWLLDPRIWYVLASPGCWASANIPYGLTTSVTSSRSYTADEPGGRELSALSRYSLSPDESTSECVAQLARSLVPRCGFDLLLVSASLVYVCTYSMIVREMTKPSS